MHVRIGLYMKITVYQALLYGWHLSVTLIPSSFRPPMLAPEFWRRTHHQIHYAIIWCAHFWRVSFLPAIITRIVITTEVILKTTLSLSLSLSLSGHILHVGVIWSELWKIAMLSIALIQIRAQWCFIQTGATDRPPTKRKTLEIYKNRSFLAYAQHSPIAH